MKGKAKNALPDIERTIIIDAPIHKVWDEVSTSEGLASWLMPNDFSPVMGLEFTFRSEPKHGWDGVVHCKVMELEPPRRLGFTWKGNNMEQYVSFELVELEKNRTQFLLVHAGWTEEHAMIREVMYEGWGYLTEDLRKKLGDENDGYLS
ncbi:MAG TPA: SRPBCC domain-containing protein [Clostridia bacterium]|nr:SRPBCC domain-containing protein [Clostridia bacterium]